MLLSIVLELSAEKKLGTTTPWSLGRAAHASFFHLLRKIDPKTAAKLHSALEKPFSISFVHKAPKAASAHENPEKFWLRITSLDGELSTLLLQTVAEPSALGRLRWLDMELSVTAVFCRAEEHPWAGQSSYQELCHNGLARAKRGEDTIGLEFASPTAFRLVNSRLNMPLPWPRLVFQSLAEKWNAFSPASIWLDWPAFDRQVSIARHRLETKVVDFGTYRQVGFVGECWFVVDRGADLKMRQALHTLADFAFFAGVGRKTTMGMGLVRRIERSP